ncbi:MAG TPA: site-specific DNA-methyltransferase [Pyrinomonadaceae bacterium]|nr:site-specific DNA-methyltransferase [Pyrinomonadaceae bacterium]
MSAKTKRIDVRVKVDRSPLLSEGENIDAAQRPPKPFRLVYKSDARRLLEVHDHEVDLVVTSPPYWRKRNYGFENQIGQEKTPDEYVANIIDAMAEWRRVLRPSGSVFLNIGDTYWQRSLQGIPSRVEVQAKRAGWRLRNRIIWVKSGGMPDPVKDRLASRHEYILHFALNGYYYDLFGYAELYSQKNKGANPGDVWTIEPQRNLGSHLAPFPSEIVKRAITLACPQYVCSKCGKPRRRIVERTAELDSSRPQAKRALEIAREKNLTPQHIAAIQATGISDAGKARRVQNGTDRNTEHVKKLASEAKVLLGGYFREFTFAKRKSCGWTDCGCDATFMPGVVLDPFMGTGTTLDVANRMGRSAIGVDLDVSEGKESPYV